MIKETNIIYNSVKQLLDVYLPDSGNIKAIFLFFHGGEIERFDFYKQAKKVYAIVATGESSFYANIMLQKGTILILFKKY